MWFARLFGGRVDDSSDDEPPTATAPQPPVAADNSAARPAAPAARKPAGKGFDPYNSGSFERRNAWERVNRR